MTLAFEWLLPRLEYATAGTGPSPCMALPLNFLARFLRKTQRSSRITRISGFVYPSLVLGISETSAVGAILAMLAFAA